MMWACVAVMAFSPVLIVLVFALMDLLFYDKYARPRKWRITVKKNDWDRYQ